MKFSVLATAFLASFVPPAQADFDVFMIERKYLGGAPDKQWQVWDLNDRVTCTGVFERKAFDTLADVSKFTGVRCKGACNIVGPTRDIEQLEMNFRKKDPAYHWTIYKDRDYGMYSLNGTKLGDCSITTSNNDYHCEHQILIGLFKETVHGYNKFYCKSQFTAKEILGL
ncbi:hypothetical protein FSHL1_012518 [Fusarium sambucinum]